MSEPRHKASHVGAPVDAYWNDGVRGLGLTGMGDNHMKRITDAQRRCRKALEAEGVQP